VLWIAKKKVTYSYSIDLTEHHSIISAEIAQKYHVSKYPTIKMFRFGELMKKEYRFFA